MEPFRATWADQVSIVPLLMVLAEKWSSRVMVEGGAPSGNLNKRSRRGCLWFRRLETFPECHAQLSVPQFFQFLIPYR